MRNLDHVAALVAVVEAGGFAAAARHLGLTTQAVQKAVANMEAELGLRLFQRATKVGLVTLTEAGAAYVEGCRRVLAAVDEAEGTVARYRPGSNGLLRVSMPPELGRSYLMPALAGFLDRHPTIKVAAVLTDRSADALEVGVDAAFQVAPSADSRLVRCTLAAPVFRIVASPAYLARRGTPRDLADVEAGGHECISLSSPITGRPFPWRVVESDGRSGKREVRGRLAVTDSGAALAAAVAGLGLVQLPDYVNSRALARGELVEVLPEHRHDGPPISIVCSCDGRLSAEVQALVDYFVEWFASGKPPRPAF